MKLIDIKESGSSNLLMWAIKNEAKIQDDIQLTSIINNELVYLVTLEDVNFFELFRLTQIYREKLRICDESPAELPNRKILSSYFPGEYIHKDEKQDEEKRVPLHQIAESAIEAFLNLVSQMSTDNDIIRPGTARLFIPMISRKFTVQIPVSFLDILESMSETEVETIFTSEYPKTLNSILQTDSNGVRNVIAMGFVKGTQFLKYNKRYDQYLKAVKYAPLKNFKGNQLYKFSLLGFSKRDNISRSEVRLNLFKQNPQEVPQILKRMGRLNTPLELDFAIQLPIQHMQILENSFDREVLPINYESSMSVILENGLMYEDFNTLETYTEDSEELVKEYNNSIEAYRVRIAEANEKTIKILPILLSSSDDVDTSAIFSLLPSLYTSIGVITIKSNDIDKFIKDSTDTVIAEMFRGISNISESVLNDIRKSK